MLIDLRKSRSDRSVNSQSMLSVTDDLRVLMIKQKLRMSCVMFWFLLLVFAVILSMLLYLTISGKGDIGTRIGLLLFDGIIGVNIRQIVSFLFPILTVTEQKNRNKPSNA